MPKLSLVFICLLSTYLVCVELRCRRGYFLDEDKCVACSSLPFAVQSTSGEECGCLQNLKWNSQTKTCASFQQVQKASRYLLGICIKNQYTNALGSCVKCPSTNGYLVGTSISKECTCNVDLKFAWNSTSFMCTCIATYFLTDSSTCVSCPQGAGYSTDSTIDGECTCNIRGNFSWSSTQKRCVCAPNYFLDSSSCRKCPEKLGYIVDKLTDEACQCDTARRYSWNKTDLICACSPNFYATADNQCWPCPTTKGYLTNDTLSDGQCACDSSLLFLWSSSSLACVCKLNYYFSQINTCQLCPSTAGYLPATELSNTCLCDATKNFVFNSQYKCGCKSGYSLASDNVCYCSNGSFLNKQNRCISCQDMTGAVQGLSEMGECKCDGSKFFEWSRYLFRCVCKNTYYQDSNGDCKKCSSQMYANDQSAQGECICEVKNLLQWSSSSKTCICKPGYYRNTKNNVCQLCNQNQIPECSCDATKFLQYYDNSCICQTGYFMKKESTSEFCSSCNDMTGAVIYTSENNKCICDFSQNFMWSLSQLKCICVKDYYLKNNTCNDCITLVGNTKSEEQENKGSKCSCLSSFAWSERDNKCVCDRGFYLNIKNICTSCTQLNGANNNSSNDQCVCKTAELFTWSTTFRQCVCFDGLFLSNNKCVICAGMKGLTWNTPISDGKKCNCDFEFEWSPTEQKCVCKLTTYLDLSSGSCKQCSLLTGAIAKTSKAGTCDCASDFTWSTTLNLCVCKSSFYLFGNVCKSCPTTANTFTNGGSTDGKCNCKSGFFWSADQQKCICADTHYLKNNACSPCNSLQATKGSSINGVQCVCIANSVWSTSSLTCVCNPAYYYKTSTKTCEKCSSVPGSSTSSADKGVTCGCKATLTWNSTLGACKCSSAGNYVSATGACATCKNVPGKALASTSNGVKCDCDSTKNLVWNDAKFTCQCKANQYLNINKVCLSCVAGGGNDGTSTNFRCNCKTDKNFIWKDASYACVCKDNFYLKSSTECVSCSTIVGANTAVKTTDGKKCECKNGSSWDAPSKRCMCTTLNFYMNTNGNCYNCSTKGTGSTNLSDKFICYCDGSKYFSWNSNLNKCICKGGYYRSNSGSCVSCPTSVGTKPTTINVSEVCDCDNTFKWSTTAFKCVCSIESYINNKVCAPCTDLAGATKGIDGVKCICTTPMSWNGTLFACTCSNTSYIKSKKTCTPCKDLIGLVPAGTSNGVVCNCNTEAKFVWDKTSQSCVCLGGYYLFSITTCLPCSCKANFNPNGTVGPNNCACNPTFQWINGECICPFGTTLNSTTNSCQ